MPVTRDVVTFGVLVFAFATLVTVHVTLAFGLARRASLKHGSIALIAPPLAPYWGWREGMRVRGVLWVFALLVYVGALVAVYTRARAT